MTTLFCCLVALMLAVILFGGTVMAKLAAFVTHRPVAAGVMGALLTLVAFAVPYVLLSIN